MIDPEEGRGPIVVGFDGRPGGEDALALARDLALAGDHRIVVLAVHRAIDSVAGLGADAEWLHLRARKALTGIRLVTTVAVPDASPANALAERAAMHGAELIVVGAPHRSRPGRALLGSVSLRLVRLAECPVAVAPAGYAERAVEPTSVGVAYDGSPGAAAAAHEGIALASDCGLPVRIVSVLDPPVVVGLPPRGPDAIDVERDGIERRLAELLERVPPGVDATAEVIAGNPGRRLAALSREVSLLVVGARARTPLEMLLVGSVTSSLASSASCPMVIVPPDVQVPAEGPARAASAAVVPGRALGRDQPFFEAPAKTGPNVAEPDTGDALPKTIQPPS